MAKAVLILFLAAGLIGAPGFMTGPADPASTALHDIAPADLTHADAGSHDDAANQTGGAANEHLERHDPADHSHQVVFFQPETRDHFPLRKSNWHSASSPDMKPDTDGRIDRPPRVS